MTETVPLDFERRGPVGGTPIVLLGSLGSDRTMWRPQLDALSDEFDVLAVELRGHGRSPVPTGPYSVSDLAADVAELLFSLSLPSAHVVGLSLGGAVAQELALAYPRMVARLTLMCTSARFGETQPFLDRAAAVRADGTASLAQTVVGRWFTAQFAARNPRLVESMCEMVAGTSDEGYAACCEALAGFDSRDRLPEIAAPTLVIGGAEDPATGLEHQRAIAESIPGARLLVVDHAAHLASFEQRSAVNAAIVEQMTGSRE